MLTDDGLAEIRDEAKRLRYSIDGLRNVLNVLWVIAIVAAVEMVTLIVTLSGE